MTTVTPDRREADRRELADLLEQEIDQLRDHTTLTERLGLDSLAMMRVHAWLEARGVQVEAHPRTVGDLLALLERPVATKLRVYAPDGSPLGPSDDDDGPRDPLIPILHTKHLRLTVVEPDDMSFLYMLAAHPETGFRWRYRGSPPPPDRFAADLWTQVLVQFVVRRVDNNQPVGLVVSYAADLSLRHAYLGALFHHRHTGSGLAAQAVSLFVDYLFQTFPLRKLYLEVPGFNWPQLQSGQGRMFQVEGVFRDHDYYHGRYWDKYVCAIYPTSTTQGMENNHA
ncbi:GNAT family N-acetyltransferase [Allorhizocola rhizosphaerae]|uniref:GNAT family N-acetyltransferase n=1 Tax=Allorhizocola rhizosphaerae TaxID=1872709 RepID=UPI000E3E611B|nr:GNAT family N-acetyltransferase [Allorhizocola rhizosphaerae]